MNDNDLRATVIEMRRALKDIASFYNPSGNQSEGGQAAARKARETLERLGLLYQDDAKRRGLA